MIYILLIVIAIAFIGALVYTMKQNSSSVKQADLVLPGENGEADQVLSGVQGGSAKRQRNRPTPIVAPAEPVADPLAWQAALADDDEDETPEFSFEDTGDMDIVDADEQPVSVSTADDSFDTGSSGSGSSDSGASDSDSSD